MNRSHFRPTRLSDPSETYGYKKIIKELEDKIDFHSESPKINASLIIPIHPSPDKYRYAEELKLQILQQAQSKEQEKAERKKPAISEDFYGYPNLPQTPPKIRRLRQLEQMKKMQESLNTQLQIKKDTTFESKNKINEHEKLLTEKDIMKMKEEKYEKISKKEKYKEILIKSWDLASKTNELKKKIEETERKGNSTSKYDYYDNTLSPTTSRIFKDDMDIKNQITDKILNTNKDHKYINPTKLALIKKAQALRDSIELKIQNSYQHKIKKILEQAKNTREIKRNKYSNSQTGHLLKPIPSPT
ncbi:hypothetical protein SteCoe_24835 [Stentor coeruleus]|uniref:Uncharacterized protein n=1 Tax=Stentor coeruleus TaxID=5963 RepID=A0A1R2BGS7_9CILI|nr:hypothetical protein SteCoe_24835 [Stentor coeruleus]